MKRLMAMVVLALACACGSANSFNGTVAGNSFAPKNAIFAMISSSNSGGQGNLNLLAIVMSEVPNLCSQLKANTSVKNSSAFELGLFTFSGQTSVVPGVGTYPIFTFSSNSSTYPAGNISVANFSKTDANCQSVFTGSQPTGTSGKVELTSLSIQAGGHASGSFDVNLNTDHVTGSFNADYCDITEANLTNSGTPVCQ